MLLQESLGRGLTTTTTIITTVPMLFFTSFVVLIIVRKNQLIIFCLPCKELQQRHRNCWWVCVKLTQISDYGLLRGTKA